MKVTLGIVIPCYNEEELLPETASRMLDLLKRLMQSNKIAQTSTIYFVDDGSKDQTWSIIEDLARNLARTCITPVRK